MANKNYSVDLESTFKGKYSTVGTYKVKALVKADGYNDSAFSEVKELTIYSITVTTENITAASTNPTLAAKGGTVTLTYTTSGDYQVPAAAPTVTGADASYVKVNEQTCRLVLTNISGNISFSIAGTQGSNFLCFTALSSGTTVSMSTPTTIDRNMEYRKNGGGWITWFSSSVSPKSITLSRGDTLEFRGYNKDGLSYIESSGKSYSYCTYKFSISASVSVSGSVMSLLDNGMGTTTTIPSVYCFYQLFKSCPITTSPELPATTLASNCYASMFEGCTELTTVPALPATNLTYACYHRMFYGCTSLTESAILPATTLAGYCYYQMFYGCTSLTKISKLPATTLSDYCYYNMYSMTNVYTVFDYNAHKTLQCRSPYRIPTSGTGTEGTNSLENMFSESGSQGGSSVTPYINRVGYLSTPAIFTYQDITVNSANLTADAENPTTINRGESATLTFTANSGYTLPANLIVIGATYSWNSTTGVLTLTNPTQDVVVSIGGQPTSGTFTNLTGTTWQFNDTVDNDWHAYKYLNFMCGDNSFIYDAIYVGYYWYISGYYDQVEYSHYEDGSLCDVTAYDGAYGSGAKWRKTEYKTIKFISRTDITDDITDEDLIEWVQENATQITT